MEAKEAGETCFGHGSVTEIGRWNEKTDAIFTSVSELDWSLRIAQKHQYVPCSFK